MVRLDKSGAYSAGFRSEGLETFQAQLDGSAYCIGPIPAGDYRAAVVGWQLILKSGCNEERDR
jgi:hypothetical protein